MPLLSDLKLAIVYVNLAHQEDRRAKVGLFYLGPARKWWHGDWCGARWPLTIMR